MLGSLLLQKKKIVTGLKATRCLGQNIGSRNFTQDGGWSPFLYELCQECLDFGKKCSPHLKKKLFSFFLFFIIYYYYFYFFWLIRFRCRLCDCVSLRDEKVIVDLLCVDSVGGSAGFWGMVGAEGCRVSWPSGGMLKVAPEAPAVVSAKHLSNTSPPLSSPRAAPSRAAPHRALHSALRLAGYVPLANPKTIFYVLASRPVRGEGDTSGSTRK